MSEGLAVLLAVFVALMLLDAPIAFVIGIATVMAAWALGYGDVLISVARDMGNGLDSFALLAIPFFILAGDLMGAGGLAGRLIDFAAVFLGRFRGGLAMVNTLTCMLFGAISGSAAAAVSSVGGTLIPEMNRKGYPKDFNIALTATAATTGLLIPPSNVMIVYAVVASNVSISALFIAGVMPGIVIGLLIMGVALIVSRRNGYGGEQEHVAGEIKRSALVLHLARAAQPAAGRLRARRNFKWLVHADGSFRSRGAVGLPAGGGDLPRSPDENVATAGNWLGANHRHCHAVGRSEPGDERAANRRAGATVRQRGVAGIFLQSADDPSDDQHHPAGGRHVHGHDAGGAGVHADLPAGGSGYRNRSGALRNDPDRQPLHRPVHSAGRHLPVPRLQRRQVEHRERSRWRCCRSTRRCSSA